MALSVLVGIWRGAVREVFALAGWIAAFYAAQYYAVGAGLVLPDATPPEFKLLAGFCVVFLATLVLAGVVGWVLSRLLHAAGLGLLDRTLGALIGLARGALVVLVLALAAGLTSLPRQPAWRHAAFSAPIVTAVLAIRPWLPPELGRRVKY